MYLRLAPIRPLARGLLRQQCCITTRRMYSGIGARIRPARHNWLLYASVIATTGTVAMASMKLVANDEETTTKTAREAHLSIQKELVSDPAADTFESGLYKASQQELDDEKAQNRKKQTERPYVGVLYKLGYFLQDYLLEPTLVFTRFLQLAALFLPVALAYPMTFFGSQSKQGDTTGALKWYQLVRLAAEAAGPSFIKLGQWTASRTDIFSQAMCDELSKLHSNAKSHSFSATKQIIESEFNGLTIDDLFDEFYEEPIGCGAIAQVYLAKLNPTFIETFGGGHNSNNEEHDSLVAVKVEHPGVAPSIERDLKIMQFFASAIDVIPTMEWLSLPQEVDQFAIMMKLQLDMRIEEQNLNRFINNFAGNVTVNFPTPWFTSRQILIEERVQGLGMNRILELNRDFGKKMSKQISDYLVDAFLKMMILDNFVHADLHPGNMFIRFQKTTENGKRVLSTEAESDELNTRLSAIDDNATLVTELQKLYDNQYRPQVCFIDAGLVTELNDTNRYNFISLFTALSQFDGYKAGELMIERSRTPETVVDPDMFKYKVEKLVDQVRQRTFTLGSISIGDILEQMLSMVRVHHVRMEGDFVTVVVAILLLEGIGRQLDPDLDLFARFVYAWHLGFPTY